MRLCREFGYISTTAMHVFVLICCFKSLSSSKQYDAYIDRTEELESNPKYVSHWIGFTHRPNRTSPYTFNANVTFLRPLYNNVTIQIVAFEKLSNVYKHSVNVFKGGVCDWVKNEKLIYGILSGFSNLPKKCPIQGNILISDAFIRSEVLPPYLPMQDLKLDFKFFLTDSKETILYINLYVMIVEKAKKKNKG